MTEISSSSVRSSEPFASCRQWETVEGSKAGNDIIRLHFLKKSLGKQQLEGGDEIRSCSNHPDER